MSAIGPTFRSFASVDTGAATDPEVARGLAGGATSIVVRAPSGRRSEVAIEGPRTPELLARVRGAIADAVRREVARMLAGAT